MLVLRPMCMHVLLLVVLMLVVALRACVGIGCRCARMVMRRE